MRITLSLPDAVARKFQAVVPSRERSRLVARLLVDELKRKETALEEACLAANRDKPLQAEIEEWQSFDDGTEG